MAYDNYNNQNQKSDFHPRVFSPYKFNNAESTVDQTCLAFSFWNNTLCIKIAPKKQNTQNIQFDMDAAASLYLSYSKARMFLDIIQKFKEDPDRYSGYGVPSGKGLLTICNGKEYGSNKPCIVIRNVDETGATSAEYVYETKAEEYYYGITNYNPQNGQYDVVNDIFNNIELNMIECVLTEYIKASTLAVAASCVEANNYEFNRMNTKLESIGSKLGVDLSGGKRYNNKSYFSNSNNDQSMLNGPQQQFTSGSMSDLDDYDM